ncbi:MAG: hypothetical protein JXA71_01870 [Chitinispirillaceae bacterium]|nr:hypothetical protein [Chitinispirillaceae bacterium]
MKRMFTTAILTIALTATAFGQTAPQAKSGDIDWEKRSLIATGIGASNPNMPQAAQRPGALRAAQMVALRNALELAKGINLNSSSTIEEQMTTSDVVTTSIDGFLKGFQQKGRDRYMNDGSVELTMEIPLDGEGGMTGLLLGKTLTEQPVATAFEGKKAKKETEYTGLIINAKGLSIKPALAPVIIDEEGKAVYGPAYISKEWAVKHGTAGYVKNKDKTANLERTGKKPADIKALKATGKYLTDVIISTQDAARIRSTPKNLKMLSECRVVLIID